MKTLLTAVLAVLILTIGEKRRIDGPSVWTDASQGVDDLLTEAGRLIRGEF